MLNFVKLVVDGMKKQAIAPALIIYLLSLQFPAERIVRRDVTVGDLLFNGMDVSNFAALFPDNFPDGRFGLYQNVSVFTYHFTLNASLRIAVPVQSNIIIRGSGVLLLYLSYRTMEVLMESTKFIPE
jgi:hypothetical protein